MKRPPPPPGRMNPQSFIFAINQFLKDPLRSRDNLLEFSGDKDQSVFHYLTNANDADLLDKVCTNILATDDGRGRDILRRNLIERIEPNEGNTPVHFVQSVECLNVILKYCRPKRDQLLSVANKTDQNLLHLLCAYRNYSLLACLFLTKTVSIEAFVKRNKDGVSPLLLFFAGSCPGHVSVEDFVERTRSLTADAPSGTLGTILFPASIRKRGIKKHVVQHVRKYINCLNLSAAHLGRYIVPCLETLITEYGIQTPWFKNIDACLIPAPVCSGGGGGGDGGGSEETGSDFQPALFDRSDEILLAHELSKTDEMDGRDPGRGAGGGGGGGEEGRFADIRRQR